MTTTPPDEFEAYKLIRGPLYSFQSQVEQYPTHGTPNTIELFLGDLGAQFPGKPPVNCLLWRDKDGLVRGILNHYPDDYPPLESRGNVNMWVQDGWKRQGIGKALWERAGELFGPLDFDQQNYSREGVIAMVNYRRHREPGR